MFDLVVEGKPIEKFIEVVSKAIGVVYEPRQTVRMAKAEAEAERIKAIGHAKTEALIAGDEAKVEELSLIEKRIVAKEEKRQKNIEKVVGVAAQSINEESGVSAEPVNPDWATRFFDIAQDISDEEMQDLWGRILAGEVKMPHSYSLRTLEVLKNLTSEEAQLFEKAAQYVLYDGDYYLYNFPNSKDEIAPMEYEDIARLIEIGLVQSGMTATQNYFYRGNGAPLHTMFYAERYVAFIEIPSNVKQISFPIYPLTKAGSELYKLVSIEPCLKYFENVLQCIYDKNIHKSQKICIKYAKLHLIDYVNNQLEYDEESLKTIS